MADAYRLQEQGNAAFRAGQIDKAVEYYSQSLTITPRAAVSLCHRKQANLDAAVKDAQEAITLDPNYVMAWVYATLALEEKGNVAEAIEVCRKGLDFLPDEGRLQERFLSISTKSLDRFRYEVVIDRRFVDVVCEAYDAEFVELFTLDIGPSNEEDSDGDGREFGIGWTFSPFMIDACCQRGYFPMALLIDSYFVAGIKLHTKRCIVSPNDVHITKSTRCKSKAFAMTVNKAYPEVLKRCHQRHGENWLCAQLRHGTAQPLSLLTVLAFQFMHDNPTFFRSRMHSVEVWKDDELVAGELGYTVGDIYTSQTGFYTLSGAGTIQLSGLAGLLKRQGFTVWDFGMQMDYKVGLGGSSIQRAEWLQLVKDRRTKEATLECEKICVRNLIVVPAEASATPTTNTPKTKPPTKKQKRNENHPNAPRPHISNVTQ